MAVQSATFADIHLSEEDIKSRFIQPALKDKGWDNLITSIVLMKK
jgi:type I site-specific restriction endonuclease